MPTKSDAALAHIAAAAQKAAAADEHAASRSINQMDGRWCARIHRRATRAALQRHDEIRDVPESTVLPPLSGRSTVEIACRRLRNEHVVLIVRAVPIAEIAPRTATCPINFFFVVAKREVIEDEMAIIAWKTADSI